MAVAVAAVAVSACSSTSSSAVRWTAPVGLPASSGRAEVRDVLAPDGNDGWVAVGALHDESGHAQQPAWWTSTDASSWSARSIVSITADGPRSGLLGAARAAGGVAVAGEAYSPIHGNARPLVWRTDERGALAEVPVTRELFGGPRAVGLAGITASASGVVVAGGYIAGGTWTGGTSELAPAAWTSSDGLAYERHEITGADSGDILVVRGITHHDATVVMYGDASTIKVGPGRAALWVDRGAGWQRVPNASIASPEARTTIVRGASWAPALGFVVAGIESDPSGAAARPIALTSADGDRWARRALTKAGGDVAVFDVATLGDDALVAWRDGRGLHVTELSKSRAHDLPVPAFDDVTNAQLAVDGNRVALAVSTARGAAVSMATISS